MQVLWMVLVAKPTTLCDTCLKEDLHVSGKYRKGVGHKPKKGSSVPWIKGQWNEEEDRLRNH